MQFKKSAVIRVLIVLHLSTDSSSHYIPDTNKVSYGKKNESAAHRDRIQICGNALTTMIVEACDGIVGSPDQGQLSRGSLQTKITEDCCDRECPLDYLQNYCGQTPLFTQKKTVRGKLLSRLSPRNRVRTEVRYGDESSSSFEVRTTLNWKKKEETEIKALGVTTVANLN
ncbi:hypothetical protein RUM44_007872 [Polyplax serrata]|uniref:Insulin-like domain-containing protein n=1 Tax=Polyplax serrata TaxID=468196 RepID=A0ABR1B8S0_POLSC